MYIYTSYICGLLYMAVERLRRGELNSALFSKTATRKQTKVNMVSASVPIESHAFFCICVYSNGFLWCSFLFLCLPLD